MIKQWKVDYPWSVGGVFTAIAKKDEAYVKIIAPFLRNNHEAKAWYLISLIEDGASLQITLKK